MIKDYFYLPWQQIKRRKLRSWLTLLGIVIGIAAVVSLILLGQGLKNAIDGQISGLGKDKLFIAAKGSALTPGLSIDAVKLTEDDEEVVGRTSGVGMVTSLIFTSAKIEFNDNVRYFSVLGLSTDPEERVLFGEAQSYKLLKGRWHQKGDKYKAVLGWQYTQKSLFGRAVELGDKININGQDFKVVGFWEKIGSPPDDQSVSIPIDTYAEIFNTGDEVGMIIAQAQAGEDTLKVGEQVEKELRKSRGLEEGKEDFTVQTPEQLVAGFATILNIIQAVLAGIAAISLLVGGVGIMNTMYTTVLERTKEIGVMKSLGAKNKHIMYLFLVESGFYGVGGGLVGVIIGITVAKLVELAFILFVGPAFLSIEISIPLIVGVLIFGFVIGSLSGIAPARRASKLSPVDSLRYE
jgi:putative ABC transport system permease protein